MPIDIGRKQTIEEITNGRIKKTPREESAPRERIRAQERPMTGRKAGGRR